MLAKHYELAVNRALKESVEESKYCDLLEVICAELFELSINPINTHSYERTSKYTWDFVDRVNNHMRVLVLPIKNDIKTAYVIEIDGKEVLVYDKDKSPYKEKIVDLPDEKRLNTIYKIITKDIIPEFLLNSRPNKISFTPISAVRDRLISMILNKLIKDYPQLKIRGNQLIYL